MSTCSVSENQPIYQALLDKASSYPADKPYQAKAYNKAAQTIATYTKDIYDDLILGSWYGFDGIGNKIKDFINDFIKANPKPIEKPKTVMDFYNEILESQKPVVYTAENPRRSRRIANKPKAQYFVKDNESDDEVEDDSDEEYIDVDEDVADTIEAVCSKKGWTYSDALVTDFETWLPTADKYSLEKYDYKTGKYIPRTKLEVAKYWTQNYSSSLQKQQKQQKLSKGLIKYCEKNNIEYQDVMPNKFAAWMADPANKKLISYTYITYDYTNSNYTISAPSTIPPKKNEYIFERGPTYCINKWFSTLKKSIV